MLSVRASGWEIVHDSYNSVTVDPINSDTYVIHYLSDNMCQAPGMHTWYYDRDILRSIKYTRYNMNSEPWETRTISRSFAYRPGLRPGSVGLRSRGLELAFSPALIAGRIPRPAPGLLPRAHSRGRLPPPSTAILNWARSAGSCGDGETYRGSTFYSLQSWRFVLLLLLLL